MIASLEQREYLEKLYELSEWRGKSLCGKTPIKYFALDVLHISGWKQLRVWRDDTPPPSIGVIFQTTEKLDQLASFISITLWECPSTDGAHLHLIDVLANIQSNAIKRVKNNELGDVLFTLADTMFLFARANLVVLVRNVGPHVLGLGEIANTIDLAILHRFAVHQPRKTE